MKNVKSTLFIVLLVVFFLVCGFMLGRIDFDKENNEDKEYITEDGNVVTNNNDNELQ